MKSKCLREREREREKEIEIKFRGGAAKGTAKRGVTKKEKFGL
jgi:hypothetical protein